MTMKMDHLITYNVTDAAIAVMNNEYLKLKVNGLEDKKGYILCREARTTVRNKRIEVEKRRKELKVDSLAFGKKVDLEAKRITSQLAEIEDHLKEQQDIIDNEKKRIQEEAEKKAYELLNFRILEFLKCHAQYTIDQIRTMTDAEFNDNLKIAKSEFEKKEQERLAEKKRVRELEKEQVEMRAKIEEQEEENKRLQDEMIAKQKAEIAERDRQLEDKRRHEEKARKIEADRIYKEAEEKRKAEEAQRKEEAIAANKVADNKMFNEIKVKFPTLEKAWVEIARLRKIRGDL